MGFVGLFFAGLAALLHIYIWVMESLTWTSARTRATFGLTEEEALATKELAFNQGFYNLFLAIITLAGIVIGGIGYNWVGIALIFAGVGSMLAAALVLLLSSPDKAKAALAQGIFPLIAIVLLAVAVTL
ncbi:epimerase [Mycolicibacterium acapulense]|nr:epimerase [Mycolicibacterium acapulense]KUI18444.1 epimerase [Mycolicibacterium acapulense]